MNIDKRLKDILEQTVAKEAADLHLSVGDSPVFRVDDDLLKMIEMPIISKDDMEEMVFSFLTVEEKARLEEDREIILTRNFGKNLRFKINIFYQRGFLSATLRYLPDKAFTIDELNLNKILKDLTKLPNGLVIISGPFGSGRSTTVAAMIEEININRKEYIITIEQPIEYLFTNKRSIIEQREVGSDTKSFIDAIKYFQEEDGDVLFIEEMDDPELIPDILEIARGSSLVLSILTASSVTNTISKILDSFKSFDQERIRDLLATSLKAVVCQKKVPKIGGGTAIIQEIMTTNSAVKSVIQSGNVNQLENIIQTSRQEGMISFDHVLARLVNDRVITYNTALDSASDQRLLQNLIKK